MHSLITTVNIPPPPSRHVATFHNPGYIPAAFPLPFLHNSTAHFAHPYSLGQPYQIGSSNPLVNLIIFIPRHFLWRADPNLFSLIHNDCDVCIVDEGKINILLYSIRKRLCSKGIYWFILSTAPTAVQNFLAKIFFLNVFCMFFCLLLIKIDL